MRSRMSVVAFPILLITIAAAWAPAAGQDPATAITFDKDVLPVLQKKGRAAGLTEKLSELPPAGSDRAVLDAHLQGHQAMGKGHEGGGAYDQLRPRAVVELRLPHRQICASDFAVKPRSIRFSALPFCCSASVDVRMQSSAT